MESNNIPQCARCNIKISERICKTEGGRYPAYCPTANHEALKTKTLEKYKDAEFYDFARQASLQEKDGYSNRDLGYARVRPAKPRIEEISDFIKRMDYHKIGLAFCMGLRKEAGIVEKYFSSKGLDVISAICKVGGVEKQFLGLADDEKIDMGKKESMCNPILQAVLLNQEETEFNILLGLCVGHDSLFFKNADAPCTVLAVKDRVTGHNPLAAVYTLDSYYRALNS
jgi:uncharacterized metal-binding protein